MSLMGWGSQVDAFWMGGNGLIYLSGCVEQKNRLYGVRILLLLGGELVNIDFLIHCIYNDFSH
jgi:hypothetical protein